MTRLTLRPLSDGDIDQMAAWLQEDHVKAWFEHPAHWLQELRERRGRFSFIDHFIAVSSGVPIGFGQYYPVQAAEEDWPGDLVLAGSYSIDYLIGDPKLLGQGLGRELVGQLIDRVFRLNAAQRIIVQPDPGNEASCRVLAANGFSYDQERGIYIKTRQSPIGDKG